MGVGDGWSDTRHSDWGRRGSRTREGDPVRFGERGLNGDERGSGSGPLSIRRTLWGRVSVRPPLGDGPSTVGG